jgi:hypothetical protein
MSIDIVLAASRLSSTITTRRGRQGMSTWWRGAGAASASQTGIVMTKVLP